MSSNLEVLLEHYADTKNKLDTATAMELGVERDERIKRLTEEFWRIVVSLDTIYIHLDTKLRESVRDGPLSRN